MSISFAVTPVPVTAAPWKAAPSNKSMFHFRTMSYAENVDFSFGDIFTGEVWKILSVLLSGRKE
jgi:hypothetical protein